MARLSRAGRRVLAVALAAGALVAALPADAHHSFAVHYDGEHTVTVAGVVKAFRFSNPHGVILLDVTGDEGDVAEWRIETNSPNILRRRGWTPESLTPGDAVTITGFPSRDGSNSMRVYKIEFADGRELIGQRPAAGVER